MSVIMAAIRDHEALVAVDTDSVNPTNPAQHAAASKAAAIPHLRAIVAARGPVSCAWYIAAATATASMDLDAVLARLADLSRAAWHNAAMISAVQQQPEPEATTQIVVAGWSQTLQAMTGARCDRDASGAWVVTSLHGSAYASPWEDDLIGRPLPASVAEMRDTAPLMVGMLHRRYPDKAGGGRLLVGRATRDRAGFLDTGEIVVPEPAPKPFRASVIGGGLA